MKKIFYLLFITGLVFGCTNNPKVDTNNSGTQNTPVFVRKSPDFQVDSAYFFIEKQLSFGHRIPNTPGHKRCAAWLVEKFKEFKAEVTVQATTVTKYDGVPLAIQNIIASYNPQQAHRILISAHWDSRPIADADSSNRDKPIPGANDGASGVAVLLEVARQLSTQNPAIGVDLVCWDAEDLGVSHEENSYCLGSQYWSKTPHLPGYKAKYAINLDMVGAAGATFTQEGFSKQYAQQYLDHVWQIAHHLGYGQYFLFNSDSEILDDHFYLNTIANIPTIDIIHRDLSTGGFFPHWHTQRDDIQSINKETLKAVGQTMLEVIFQETKTTPVQ